MRKMCNKSNTIFVALSEQAERFVLDERQLRGAEVSAFSAKRRGKPQWQYLTSRGFIKYVLFKKLGVEQSAVELCFDAQKGLICARLDEEVLAWVSLSHSGNKLAIAYSFTKDCGFGIDIEYLLKERDYLALAKLCCAETELSKIERAESIKHAFYDIWTLREALAKATNSSLTSLFLTDAQELMLSYELQSREYVSEEYICRLVFPNGCNTELLAID